MDIQAAQSCAGGQAEVPDNTLGLARVKRNTQLQPPHAEATLHD